MYNVNVMYKLKKIDYSIIYLGGTFVQMTIGKQEV